MRRDEEWIILTLFNHSTVIIDVGCRSGLDVTAGIRVDKVGQQRQAPRFQFLTSLPPRALDLILSSVLAWTQIADNRATIVPAARAMPMRVLVAASGAGAGDGPGVGEGVGEGAGEGAGEGVGEGAGEGDGEKGDTLVESWARTAPSG